MIVTITSKTYAFSSARQGGRMIVPTSSTPLLTVTRRLKMPETETLKANLGGFRIRGTFE